MAQAGASSSVVSASPTMTNTFYYSHTHRHRHGNMTTSVLWSCELTADSTSLSMTSTSNTIGKMTVLFPLRALLGQIDYFATASSGVLQTLEHHDVSNNSMIE